MISTATRERFSLLSPLFFIVTLIGSLPIGWHSVAEAAEPLVVFDSTPYLNAQFYMSRPLAVAGEPVRIHVEPEVAEGAGLDALNGTLVITDRDGETVRQSAVAVRRADDFAGEIAWTPEHNGLYTARVTLEAADGSAEASADLTIPVRVADRPVHFVWYRHGEAWDHLRWASLFTATKAAMLERLQRRGITCLDWSFGPMHMPMPADRGQWPESIRQRVRDWAEFAEENEPGYDGLGLDEFGGFAGTEDYEKTDAFLREMNRQREALHEGSVIASWAAGGMPMEWASLHRQTADFVLLELYILGYFPPTTGTEAIYGMIDNRVDVMRARDMFEPAWGNQATTLIALDSNMRHGMGEYHPGEIENVIRYLRRVAPEMRGFALYNGSEGKGGKYEAMRDRNSRLFDELLFEYFIKPVVTLPRESLWIEDGEAVVAISNIGAMDSGAVTVELLEDGEVIDTTTVESVPAGHSRHDNRVLVRMPWDGAAGPHRLEVRIADVAFGTVLDWTVQRDVFVNQR